MFGIALHSLYKGFPLSFFNRRPEDAGLVAVSRWAAYFASPITHVCVWAIFPPGGTSRSAV